MYIFQPERYLLEQQIQELSRYIDGEVLDVGAGTFDRYSLLFKYVSRYVRMETRAGKGIDVVGTIYKIPFPDRSFDSIVCTQVFEHIARPSEGAGELYRVLKPGGHALVTVPQVNELHEVPHDYFRYTRYGLEELFASAGFEIVEMRQRGGYFATIAQLRIRYTIDRFQLYSRPMLGRVAGKIIAAYGRYMVKKDFRYQTDAAKKHALGWAAVLRKPA